MTNKVSLMGLSQNEVREENIMMLRNQFNLGKVITVKSATKSFGYTKQTIISWAKQGNIPLLISNQETVVPLTSKNKPKWMN